MLSMHPNCALAFPGRASGHLTAYLRKHIFQRNAAHNGFIARHSCRRLAWFAGHQDVPIQQAGVFHFIIFSCYHRRPCLAQPNAYRIFQHHLEQVRRRCGFIVTGYVLMPEHVHLLVNEPKECSLATAIQILKQQTSKELKQPGDTQFWQRRYYDFNVWSVEKPSEKLRYMHRNPVKQGLVERPED